MPRSLRIFISCSLSSRPAWTTPLALLQGIALSSDPNYKVLGAAYPWIARRLLSDPSPELQETLRGLLYKDDKFQFSRLESLLAQALRSPARIQRTHLSEPPTTTPDITGAHTSTFLFSARAGGVSAILRVTHVPSASQDTFLHG